MGQRDHLLSLRVKRTQNGPCGKKLKWGSGMANAEEERSKRYCDDIMDRPGDASYLRYKQERNTVVVSSLGN